MTIGHIHNVANLCIVLFFIMTLTVGCTSSPEADYSLSGVSEKVHARHSAKIRVNLFSEDRLVGTMEFMLRYEHQRTGFAVLMGATTSFSGSSPSLQANRNNVTFENLAGKAAIKEEDYASSYYPWIASHSRWRFDVPEDVVTDFAGAKDGLMHIYIYYVPYIEHIKIASMVVFEERVDSGVYIANSEKGVIQTVLFDDELPIDLSGDRLVALDLHVDLSE